LVNHFRDPTSCFGEKGRLARQL
ncbi:putative exported domain protein, partial [Vibrio parahaemolyticus V-223/04]